MHAYSVTNDPPRVTIFRGVLLLFRRNHGSSAELWPQAIVQSGITTPEGVYDGRICILGRCIPSGNRSISVDLLNLYFSGLVIQKRNDLLNLYFSCLVIQKKNSTVKLKEMV